MKKVKILFIMWTYSWGGGAENILTNLVNHLDPEKYEIDILEYFHFDVKKEPVNSNINVLPPIIDSNKAGKMEKFYKLMLVKNFPSLLRKKYCNKDYDIEIAFTKMIPSFLLNYKKKTVIWLHGDINKNTDSKSDIKLQEKYLKKADKVVMISKYNEELLLKQFSLIKSKSKMIYNSFNFNQLDYKANLEKLPKSDVPILLCLGRLESGKNPLFLLKVAQILKERKINFKLQYIGHGDLMEPLKNKIVEMNLDDCVEVLGFKENPYPYIKNSTLLVQSSKSEGFPTVFAECTYLGKPFVCTKVGGTYELSDDNKCGYVIDKMDDEQFADKVEELLTNKQLYEKFSKRGMNNVKRFTIEEQVKKFDELVDELRR